MDFIKIENTCFSEPPKGMKRQVTNGEKIFVNHISDLKKKWSPECIKEVLKT